MADRQELTTRARAMRREPTDAERRMWRLLRGRQFERLKFRRQTPLGRYIADFACLDPRVVIECDGGQHGDNANDAERDAWLRPQGSRVLRFWNHDVLHATDGVAQVLLEAFGRPRRDPSPSRPSAGPLPLPQGERGQELDR